MIRRPPRSTQSRSSAASDVYKRQPHCLSTQSRFHPDRRDHVANIKQQKKRIRLAAKQRLRNRHAKSSLKTLFKRLEDQVAEKEGDEAAKTATSVSYTHLRAHETR